MNVKNLLKPGYGFSVVSIFLLVFQEAIFYSEILMLKCLDYQRFFFVVLKSSRHGLGELRSHPDGAKNKNDCN